MPLSASEPPEEADGCRRSYAALLSTVAAGATKPPLIHPHEGITRSEVIPRTTRLLGRSRSSLSGAANPLPFIEFHPCIEFAAQSDVEQRS